MFIIEYNKYGHPQKTLLTDIKDVVDVVIGIVNNTKLENKVYHWASNATFGDVLEAKQNNIKIRCVYNAESIYPLKDSRNKQPDIFTDKKKLQVIANEISRQTGIDNEFIGEDNDSLTWDFATGVSYMKNRAGKGLYFALNDDNGREICDIVTTDASEFIRKVVTVIKRRQASEKRKVVRDSDINTRKSVPNNLIIAVIKNADSAKLEWHGRIYNDGCWWIDMERHPYGQFRFWVGFEDKRSGACNQSLYNIHRYEGSIRTGCEFRVKKSVAAKIESIFKALEKEGFV